ncbi:hypothetical protein DV736_g4471, partial [Chaetothyriales sp. CBS 134916]
MPSFSTSPANGVERQATNTVLERDQSQWLFTPAELMRTPSILAGMPVQQELANRQKGVNFITQVGIMLKLPQLTLATAAVYLHRFFMRHAMPFGNKPGLHHYSVAATALFLATKVEENCRKMKELIVACCRVAQKQPNLVVDEQNKEYWKWRDTILHNEDVLLEALCFDLQLEQPYRILFGWMQYYGVESHKVLRNTSWAFLNDSHVTTLCVLHSPRTIAGAALYAGVRLAGITLPDDESGRPWWDYLDLDILEIQRACNLMFEVYENPHLPRVGQKEAYIREDGTTVFEKTRGDLSPQPDASEGGRSVRSILSQGTKRDRDEIDRDGSDEWSTAGGANANSSANTSQNLPSEALPSPKKQRRYSADNTRSGLPPPQTSGISPAPNSSRIPPGAEATIDDVQARIDDIINRSNSAASGREEQHQHQQHQASLPPESQAQVETLQSRKDDVDDAEKVDYGSEEGEV